MCLPEFWKVAFKLDIALVSNLKLPINGNDFQLKIIKGKKRSTIYNTNAEVNTVLHLDGQKFVDIISISGFSPNWCHKCGSKQLYKMSFYAVGLQFLFTETKGLNPVSA